MNMVKVANVHIYIYISIGFPEEIKRMSARLAEGSKTWCRGASHAGPMGDLCPSW